MAGMRRMAMGCGQINNSDKGRCGWWTEFERERRRSVLARTGEMLSKRRIPCLGACAGQSLERE